MFVIDVANVLLTLAQVAIGLAAQMKAYLVVTGTIFGLVGIAHLVRLFLEGMSDPIHGFLRTTRVSSSCAADLGSGLRGCLSLRVGRPPDHRLRGYRW